MHMNILCIRHHTGVRLFIIEKVKLNLRVLRCHPAKGFPGEPTDALQSTGPQQSGIDSYFQHGGNIQQSIVVSYIE